MNNSPLRYPGGKSLMTNFFVDLFQRNGLQEIVYAEPYAGGAGAAINLLLENYVDEIVINDANIGIYSFWNALVNESERFIQAIYKIPVTLTEWFKQREILQKTAEPSFELGVATFFMSRTNRSGVILGGAIGGLTEEKQNKAEYKIDCRFNKQDLIQRLEAIAANKNRIRISNEDALTFLRHIDRNVFVYLDPPYYVKGKSLYMNHYTKKDHENLAFFLQNEAHFNWVLSYDDVPQIRDMYANYDLYRFPLKYTVSKRQIGYELLTHSDKIKFPKSLSIRRTHSKNIPIEQIGKNRE
ncbi:MAG: DNA adenine methylase [Prevotella sp.]|nr:DNA adenine methylase [Prevotella sp.]